MAGALLTGTAGWLFVVFAGLALAAAIAVVVAKNPVHSALYLLLSFVLVACIFILQQAEFVGAEAFGRVGDVGRLSAAGAGEAEAGKQ